MAESSEDKPFMMNYLDVLAAFVQGKYKLLTGICLTNVMSWFKEAGESSNQSNDQTTNCLLCMEFRTMLQKSWHEYCLSNNVIDKHTIDYQWKIMKQIWSLDEQTINSRNETNTNLINNLDKKGLYSSKFRKNELISCVTNIEIDSDRWKNSYTSVAEGLLQYSDESSSEMDDKQIDFLDSSFSFRVSTSLSSVQIQMQPCITQLANEQVSFKVCSDCLSKVVYDLHWPENNRQRCISDLINHVIAMLYVSINDFSVGENSSSSDENVDLLKNKTKTDVEVLLDNFTPTEIPACKNSEKLSKICAVGPPITIALVQSVSNENDKVPTVKLPTFSAQNGHKKSNIKEDVFDVLQGSVVKQFSVISSTLKSYSENDPGKFLLKKYIPKNQSSTNSAKPVKIQGPKQIFIPNNLQLLKKNSLTSKTGNLTIYKPHPMSSMKLIKLENPDDKFPVLKPVYVPKKKAVKPIKQENFKSEKNIISPSKTEKPSPKPKVGRRRLRPSNEPQEDTSIKGIVADFLKTSKNEGNSDQDLKPPKRTRRTFKTMPIPYECHFLCIDQTLARKGWKSYWFRRCKCAKPSGVKKLTPKKVTPKFAARKYKKMKVEKDELNLPMEPLEMSKNDNVNNITSNNEKTKKETSCFDNPTNNTVKNLFSKDSEPKDIKISNPIIKKDATNSVVKQDATNSAPSCSNNMVVEISNSINNNIALKNAIQPSPASADFNFINLKESVLSDTTEGLEYENEAEKMLVEVQSTDLDVTFFEDKQLTVEVSKPSTSLDDKLQDCEKRNCDKIDNKCINLKKNLKINSAIDKTDNTNCNLNGLSSTENFNVSIKNENPIMFSELSNHNPEKSDPSSQNDSFLNKSQQSFSKSQVEISDTELNARKLKVSQTLQDTLHMLCDQDNNQVINGSSRPFIFAQFLNVVDRQPASLDIASLQPYWLKQLPFLAQQYTKQQKRNFNRAKLLLLSKPNSLSIKDPVVDPYEDPDLKSIWSSGKSRKYFKMQKKVAVRRQRNFKPRLASTSKKVLSKARSEILKKLCKHLPKEISDQESKKCEKVELSEELPGINNDMFNNTLWNVASHGKSDIFNNLQNVWGAVDTDLISKPYGAICITNDQIDLAVSALKQSNDICTFSSKRVNNDKKKNVLIIKRNYHSENGVQPALPCDNKPDLDNSTTNVSPSKILLKIKKTYDKDKPDSVIYSHSTILTEAIESDEGYEELAENDENLELSQKTITCIKNTVTKKKFKPLELSFESQKNILDHKENDCSDNILKSDNILSPILDSNVTNNNFKPETLPEENLNNTEQQYEDSPLHKILSMSDINSCANLQLFLNLNKNQDTSPKNFLSFLKKNQKPAANLNVSCNSISEIKTPITQNNTLFNDMTNLQKSSSVESPEYMRGNSLELIQPETPISPPEIIESDLLNLNMELGSEDEMLCNLDNNQAIKACKVVLESVDAILETLNDTKTENENQNISGRRNLSIKNHALNGAYWKSLEPPESQVQSTSDDTKKTQWFLRDRSKPKTLEVIGQDDDDDTSSDFSIDVCSLDDTVKMEKEYIRPPRKYIGPVFYRHHDDQIIKELKKLQEKEKVTKSKSRCENFQTLMAKEVNIQRVKQWMIETTITKSRSFLLRKQSIVKPNKKVRTRKSRSKWSRMKSEDTMSTTSFITSQSEEIGFGRHRSPMKHAKEISPIGSTEFSEQDFEDLRQFLFRVRHPSYTGPLTNNVPTKPNFPVNDIVYPQPLPLICVNINIAKKDESPVLIPENSSKLVVKRERQKRERTKKDMSDFEMTVPRKRRRTANSEKKMENDEIKILKEEKSSDKTLASTFSPNSVNNPESISTKPPITPQRGRGRGRGRGRVRRLSNIAPSEVIAPVKAVNTRSSRGVGRTYFVSGRARAKARFLNTHSTTGSYIKRILDTGAFSEL